MLIVLKKFKKGIILFCIVWEGGFFWRRDRNKVVEIWSVRVSYWDILEKYIRVREKGSVEVLGLGNEFKMVKEECWGGREEREKIRGLGVDFVGFRYF